MDVVFICINTMTTIRLRKSLKKKAMKNRKDVAQTFHKSSKAAKDQVRMEQRKKRENDRIMKEIDPNKQRKLEEKFKKKEAQKLQPKRKTIHIQSETNCHSY